MSSERKDTLKKRLDENYTAFIESLQEKTVSELIAMAPEITAAQQLHDDHQHPDRGGDLAAMQAINAEYDALHARWNTCRASDEDYESAPQFRAGFYREQGWTGERYSGDLGMADLAVIFRAYVKKHWPQCKFSVTRKHYDSFYIALMQGPRRRLFQCPARGTGTHFQRSAHVRTLR